MADEITAGRSSETLDAITLQGREIASTAPTNGQTLVWSSTLRQWIPGSSGGGGGVVDGQQIFDGSHVLAADFGIRQLLANDSLTVALDWSDPSVATLFGLGLYADGTMDFSVAKIVNGANQFGFEISDTGFWQPNINTKIGSQDIGTYFDNSGFHGTGSVIAGTKTATGSVTTTFTVTIGVTMANATYKVSTEGGNALSAAIHYVNNKTTTTFDVVYLTGLTGSVAFDWIVTP